MSDECSANSPDEFDLIHWIRQQLGPSPAVPVDIGDDCAGLALPPGTMPLVTTDMVIDGIHFIKDDISPRQIGHKAIARSVSDIAAMAGEPVAVVVAVAIPKHLSMSWLQDLVRGMLHAGEAIGVRLVGGDIASSDGPLTITVTAIGVTEPERVLRRSGALEMDVVLVTGELGGSILGRHLDFLPRTKEARWLRDQLPIHAMIDVSDGLAADANHIARESRVAIELWEEAIPISAAAYTMAESSGRSALEHALHDGEDYELIFTASAREAAELVNRADLPVRITCIGEVFAGDGMWMRKKGDERRPLTPDGWRHKL
jgi:thiamine-monophosphate kinase